MTTTSQARNIKGYLSGLSSPSVTEGEDKPLKYPAMFRAADLVLLTKIDLLPALPEVSLAAFAESLERVSPAAHLLSVSSRTGAGLDRWIAWLRGRHPGAQWEMPAAECGAW